VSDDAHDDLSGPDLARQMLEQAKARAPKPKPKRRRPSREAGDPVSFGTAIAAFLKNEGWEKDAREHAIFARWERIAGHEIADHCTPVSLRDGDLVLTAESTAWATQLRLMARQIADRVNSDLGATVVKSVRVNGPSSAKRRPGEWRVSGGRGERDTYG